MSLLAQTAGASVIDWIWFTDEVGRNVTEALRREVSLASVVVQAIPVTVGVLLLTVITRALLKPWPLARRLVPMTLAYAFGAQALFLFLLVFGLMSLSLLGQNCPRRNRCPPGWPTSSSPSFWGSSHFLLSAQHGSASGPCNCVASRSDFDQ